MQLLSGRARHSVHPDIFREFCRIYSSYGLQICIYYYYTNTEEPNLIFILSINQLPTFLTGRIILQGNLRFPTSQIIWNSKCKLNYPVIFSVQHSCDLGFPLCYNQTERGTFWYETGLFLDHVDIFS